MTNENDVTEELARAIGQTMDPEDDIDILEALVEHFDWITKEQADRMVHAAAQAILTIIERARIEAVEAERARVVAILAEAKDIIDAVQFRSLAVRIERGDHLAGDGGTAPNAPPQE